MGRIVRSWQTLVIAAVLYGAGVVAGMTWGPPLHRLAIGYAGCILACLLGAWAIARINRRPQATHERAPWVMIGWSLLAFAGLALFRLLAVLYPERISSPPVGFGLFLFAHLLLWVGVANYPGRYPRRVVAWLAMLCDLAITVGAVGVVMYLLSLHPILLAHNVVGVLAVTRWGYTLAVLLGLAVLILLLGKVAQQHQRGPRALLSLSLGLLLGGDAALAYLSLTGSPLPYAMIGLWVVGYLLLAVTAHCDASQDSRIAGRAQEPEDAPTYGTLLPPCLLLPVVLALLIRQSLAPTTGHPVDLHVIILILTGALAALLLRLLLAYAQGHWHYHVLWRNYVIREKLILTDPLTGVANQRCLMSRLEEELSRSKRYSRHFAVIFTDIDFFKMVNDVHGHHAGDQVLCAVADTLRKAIRVTDVIARYGGEEFVLVLPETTLAQAGLLADRLRERVKAQKVPVTYGKIVQVTISCGVSAYPETAENIERLLVTADEAMNEAKETGRDRVVLSSAKQRLFVVSP